MQLYAERLVAAVDEVRRMETQVAVWVAEGATDRSGMTAWARAGSGNGERPSVPGRIGSEWPGGQGVAGSGCSSMQRDWWWW